MAEYTTPLETDTRKKIDTILNNLGWETDERKKDCNVYTHRAKTKKQQKKFKGKQPDYVLYKSGTDKPIAIIEAKRSGQDLQKALQQGINLYAKPLEVPIVFVTDGSIVETYDIRNETQLKLDDQIITDFIPEKLLLRFYKEGSNIYSPEKVTHTKRELINIFSRANDLLREEGIREGIERFTEFSNILFLKLISEIEEDREISGENRILEKKYCWKSFENLPPEQMLEYINGTILPRLVNRYNHSGDVFQRRLKIETPEILKEIVDELSELTLLDADSDVKGDAFEYFLKNSVSVGNDLGEYFTPRHIVKLMVDLVNPKYEEKVYDPCCGTGGFLIEAFRHIKSKVKNTKKTKKKLEQETVYGREITSTAKIAKMNMIIIGDGHTNIQQMDSLKNPVGEQYDVVLTNFPFSQTTKHSKYYDFDTKDANPVFLKHVIDALKNGGKAGVVVPDGLLFDKNSDYVKLRKILLNECNVIAVIQLDPFVFKPYTGQPTSILIFEKGGQTEKVWFFDVVNDGFKKTGSKKGRPPIEKNDLPLLRQIWSEKPETDNSFIVEADEIRDNSYKLTMNAYKKKIPRDVPVKTLGEICEPPKLGGTPPRKNREYWKGEHPWVKITDMNTKYVKDTEEKITDKGIENSSVKLIPEGTLLFSFKLTIGKTAIAGRDLYTNEAIAGLIPKDKDDEYLTKYLYYILPTLDFTPYAQRATKGLTLNTELIGDVEIPYPEASVRKKIVEKSEERERKEAELKKEIEKLEEKQEEFIRKLTG